MTGVWMFTTFGLDTVKGGGPVAYHAGAASYFRAQPMLPPDQTLGAIVAHNDGAAAHAVNRVAGRALALLPEARAPLGLDVRAHSAVNRRRRGVPFVPLTAVRGRAGLRSATGRDHAGEAGAYRIPSRRSKSTCVCCAAPCISQAR